MRIEILLGFEAEQKIEDSVFCGQWKELYNQTPWASVFQGVEYVKAWYAAYRSQYSLAIIAGYDSEEKLSGLFTLAINTKSGELSVAGDTLAEYQAWLADPKDGNAFIEAALDRLSRTFPSGKLTLLFLLPTVPLDWAASTTRWKNRCHIKSLPRGLMAIGDGLSFKDTLRKSKQSKINRLKRMGDLHLDRIEAPEELEKIFDEISLYQTLRLRAVYNLPDAQQDPLMKEFYLNLSKHPRMIHATALRLDDKLISAQIHMYNRDQAMLGLITHSPFFSRYSPGELHILMTGLELAKEEIPVFDLTPGGRYKERYATSHDDVRVAVIFFSRAKFLKFKVTRAVADTFKYAFKLVNVSPESARERFRSLAAWKRKWLGLKPSELGSEIIRQLKRSFRPGSEIRLYSFDLNFVHRLPVEKTLMAKDRISDLLAYTPQAPWQPEVSRYLKRAIEEMEAGHHFYTRMNGGVLSHIVWMMIPRNGKSLAVEGQELSLPDQSVLIQDLCSSPHGITLPIGALSQLLHEAATVFGAKQAFIPVPAENADLCNMLENAGFIYEQSLLDKPAAGRLPTYVARQVQTEV